MRLNFVSFRKKKYENLRVYEKLEGYDLYSILYKKTKEIPEADCVILRRFL